MQTRLNPQAYFLLAPAGSGKTSLIFDFYKRNDWNILLILPLKCLEKEISKRIETIEKKENFIKAVTVEKAISSIEKIAPQKRKNLLIVLDEVHLWNFWGCQFRPHLWESLYYFGFNEFNILGLTATLRPEYERMWKELFYFGGYDFEVLNLGNGQLINRPSKEVSYFSLHKNLLKRRLCFEIEKNKTCLIFCQYREEVFELERFLSLHLGRVSVLTCVGGESEKFTQEIEKSGKPQVIICTSTLSHGVNLGLIERVFLTYEILDWDILLQMKARAGRSGEEFQVFSCQRDLSSFISKIKLKLFDRYLSLFYA